MSIDPRVSAPVLLRFGTAVMTAVGCRPAIAAEIAEHLVEADLEGVYSHGVFRLHWYAERAAAGKFNAGAEPVMTTAEGGAPIVDGGNGLGIPAFRLATDHLITEVKTSGMSAIGIANVDHTGRLGVFAKRVADAGCLAIMFGGGCRKDWRQVAPHGGARGMLPTNPFAFGIPGGARGSVVVDFATSIGAGGKVYAAKIAGRPIPEGICIDAHGRPTTNPDDYFNGGALLPMAGAKGYGMALVAELLGEAILGEVMDGMNWIGVAIDLSRYRAPSAYTRAAEACLAELRACPPAPGFTSVEIPGEREAALREVLLVEGIPLPPQTLAALRDLGKQLGLSSEDML